MALTLNDINATTLPEVDKLIVDNVYDQSPFFKKLKSMKKVAADGYRFEWVIRSKQQGLADAIDPNAKTEFMSPHTRERAYDVWRYYRGHAMITLEEKALNYGKGQVVNLQIDKAEEMKEDLANKLATDVYTANANGKGLTPLATIIGTTTAYAGWTSTDIPTWASTVDSSTTALEIYGGSTTLTGMRNAAWFGGKKPNFHLTTRELMARYEAKLEPKQRYEGDSKEAGLGFTSLFFYGDPVIGDPFCPSGYWYGLCMDVFELKVHPELNELVSKWIELDQVGQPGSFVRYVSFVGNLKCKDRQPHFVFSALDSTK